jgi:hypothetical protein
LTLNETTDLQAYLINFVNTLDPNVGKKGATTTFKLIEWPEYTRDSRVLLTALDANASTGIPSLEITKDDYREEQLKFLTRLFAEYPV